MSEFTKIDIADFVGTFDRAGRHLLDTYNNARKLCGQEPIRMSDSMLRKNFSSLFRIKKEIERWVWRNMLRDLIAHRVIVVGETVYRMQYKIYKANLTTGNVSGVTKEGVKHTHTSFDLLISEFKHHYNSDLPLRYEAPRFNLFSPADTKTIERSAASRGFYRGNSRPIPTRYESRDEMEE